MKKISKYFSDNYIYVIEMIALVLLIAGNSLNSIHYTASAFWIVYLLSSYRLKKLEELEKQNRWDVDYLIITTHKTNKGIER